MQALLLGATNEEWPTIIPLAMKRKLGIHLVSPDPLDTDAMAATLAYRAVLPQALAVRALHGPFKELYPGSPDPSVRKVAAGNRGAGCRMVLEEGEAVTSLCWLEQHGFLVRGGESFVG